MKGSSALLFFLLLASAVIQTDYCLAAPEIIPVTRFTSAAMPGGIPEGWSLEKKTGYPLLKLEKDDISYYLHLNSAGDSSFGVRKEVRVDVKNYPVLSWRWKAAKLPRGGDVRKPSVDDQALQIYVAFKETGFLGINTPIIGYIWDNEAPKGWSGRSPQIGGDKIRYIVLRNKADNLDQWYTEKRSIYQDYKTLFPDIKNIETQTLTTGLQIYINSQRTKSPAEGMIADIYFSNEPADITQAQVGQEQLSKKVVIISTVKPPPAPKKRVEKLIALAKCLTVTIEFTTDSIIVGDIYKDRMQEVADYLNKHEDAKLNIVGHTDNIGNEDYNEVLSYRRADSVMTYLMEQFGINPMRLNVRGAGSQNPAADNSTPEGRKLNRSVIISDCPE